MRNAFRVWRSSPLSTLVAIATLMLAVGATTAIVAIVHSVLMKPLPYVESDRLVTVFLRDDNPARGRRASPPNVREWQARSATLSSLGAYEGMAATVVVRGVPRRFSGTQSVGPVFATLGVAPLHGRWLMPEDDRDDAPPVIVLSYRLWQELFAGDASAVGQGLLLGDRGHTIVGVMPPAFRFPSDEIRFWIPAQLEAQARNNLADRRLIGIGRLATGHTLASARVELDGLQAQFRAAHPEVTESQVRVLSLLDQYVGDVRTRLLVLMGAVAIVLLGACANLANLLIARAAPRQREIAVRRALGASTARVVRQLLIESAMLGVAGGLAGLLLGWWTLRAFVALLPEDLPRINEISLDWQVAAVALACSIGASLLLGLAPAWQLTRANPDRALRSGATADPAARALRSTLMAAEVGLAMVLLIGAGLLLRTFVELQRVDPGFPASRLLTFRLNLDPDRYPNEQRIAFFERLLEAIRGLPRVEAASLISQAPLTGAGPTARFGVIGRPADRGDEAVLVPYRIVEADYFRTAGVPLLRGRLLSAGDTRANGAPVVIDSALAREFFSDRDPIGQRIMLGEPSEPLLRRATIVGIVGEVKQLGLDLPAPGMLYVPQRVMPNRPNFSCVVRTAGDPFLVLPAIRTLVQSFDSSLPVAQVQTMEDLIEESLRPTRSSMLALAGFAGLALAMTGVGLFGVVTYVTSQRQREFAIRLTLGAQPRTLRRLVLGEGIRPVVIGLAAGAAGAIGLARFARSLLYGVSSLDPIAVAGATVLVLVVAAAACYAPVRRATRVDPMMLLRAE